MIWARDPGAAVALARRTVREIGTNPELLPVRVGVHTGTAIRRGRDWYGSAVNVAARLAAQAQPNEALISAATTAAVADRTPSALTDRRTLTLRGVGRPVDAWRLS
jgi:class 3 adenylate cyclase